MGINGNIKKEWRSIPTMYQGLGLPCFPLVALAKKISFLQENWGNTGVAQSDALSLAYDDFIMEVGLYGDPLSWEYINYGQLATQATWFSNLWQLCHTYQATVSINKSGRQITPICKNNRSIMSEFYRIGFRGNQLVGLNTVQKYKHFIHVSDMILCDGRTIDPFSLSDEQILSVQHVFSREEPTHANFSLRRSAISSLCEGTTGLPYALGPFVLPPHLEVYWYINLDSSILYCVDNKPSKYQVLTRLPQSRATRHGWQFEWSHQNDDNKLPTTHVASAKMVSNTRAVLHSAAVLPTKTPEQRTFLETLHALGNPTLWENMHINGDGEWIREGLLQGIISIAHNGSFMQEESVDLCSATIIIFCSTSDQWAKVLVVEHSNSADNFRGELLGAVIIQYILRAAAVDLQGTISSVCIFCDNQGVIAHGNSLQMVLPDKQAQSDLIYLLKSFVSSDGVWMH